MKESSEGIVGLCLNKYSFGLLYKAPLRQMYPIEPDSKDNSLQAQLIAWPFPSAQRFGSWLAARFISFLVVLPFLGEKEAADFGTWIHIALWGPDNYSATTPKVIRVSINRWGFTITA